MACKRSEDALITLLRSVYNNTNHGPRQVVAQPLTKLPSMTRLSTLPAPNRALQRPNRARAPGFGGRRQFYATVGTRKKQIAILGAGITGLTTAHYLARHAKNAHITILEASHRAGGWIDAQHLQLGKENGRQVLLQRGPRMLRSNKASTKYDDLVFYDVVTSLRLNDKIRLPQAAVKNRYIYYPDRLVKLPSGELSLANIGNTFRSLLNDSLWDGCIKSLISYIWHKLPSPDVAESVAKADLSVFDRDKSVAQYLTSILGDERPINNIASAMMHGIYGGDVNKLSVRHTILDHSWYTDTMPAPGSWTWMNLRDMYLMNDIINSPNRWGVIYLAERAIKWNSFMFDDGLMSLVKGLVEDLEKQSNVTINYNQRVTSLSHGNGRVSVTTSKSGKRPDTYDQVICTLFSKHLSQIAQPPNSLPSLAETHAVTIMVVNLWYQNPDLLNSNHGFGYLVPTSTPDNDECVLGVLFDSDIQPREETPGTILTVMLGGHHWDDWNHLPTEEMGIEMAKQAVKKHLGIDEKEKVHATARLCRDCLPQHFVGHRDRMKRAHYELLDTFKGQVTVAGPSYTNVGVIPAMRAGFDAAMRVAHGRGPPWFPDWKNDRGDNPNVKGHWDSLIKLHAMAGVTIMDHVGATGLEFFTEPLSNYMKLRREGQLRFRKWTDPHLRFLDDDGNMINRGDI